MTADLRTVATELLRLYDWRFELAKEEETLQNTPIDAIDVRDVAMREASDFEAAPLIQRRATLDKKLRQYGREKKAAWERLRALLARPAKVDCGEMPFVCLHERPVDEPCKCIFCGDVEGSLRECCNRASHVFGSRDLATRLRELLVYVVHKRDCAMSVLTPATGVHRICTCGLFGLTADIPPLVPSAETPTTPPDEESWNRAMRSGAESERLLQADREADARENSLLDAPTNERVDALEGPHEAGRVLEGIDYLDSIGMGNCADAIRCMAAREEARKATWAHCDCGARRPPNMRCPTCDDHAIMPCICREYLVGEQPCKQCGRVVGSYFGTPCPQCITDELGRSHEGGSVNRNE